MFLRRKRPAALDDSRELAALEDLAGIPRGNLSRAMIDYKTRGGWVGHVTDEQSAALVASLNHITAIAVRVHDIATYWQDRNRKESQACSTTRQ